MKGQKLLDVIEMEVNNAVLGKEVLTIDSYYDVSKHNYTPRGMVGIISGVFSCFDLEKGENTVLVRVQSKNSTYELPITYVQEVINYIPFVGDKIQFPDDDGIVDAIVTCFGKGYDGYVLFIKVNRDGQLKYTCISSKQVCVYEK